MNNTYPRFPSGMLRSNSEEVIQMPVFNYQQVIYDGKAPNLNPEVVYQRALELEGYKVIRDMFSILNDEKKQDFLKVQ